MESYSPSPTQTNDFFFNKQEEAIFYGLRSNENPQYYDFLTPRHFSKKTSSQHHLFQKASTLNDSNENSCFQCFLIPYQNGMKNYFDVFMMFLVAYSVFTNVY